MTKLQVITTMRGAQWGGSEAFWLEVARAAIRRGIRVEVVTENPKLSSSPAALGLRESGVRFRLVTAIMSHGLAARFGLNAARRRAIHRLVDSFRPDSVLVSLAAAADAGANGVAAAAIAKALSSGIPYSLIPHGNNFLPVVDSEKRHVLTNAYQSARVCVFVAPSYQRALETQFVMRMDNALVAVSPCNTPEGLEASDWPSGMLRFAIVCRLDSLKGVDVAISAFSRLRQRGHTSCRLSIYGEGDARDYLEALSSAHGLGDMVSFKGSTSNVVEVWRNHHVCLLASRAEVAPLAVVEAMRCGRPAVVSDIGCVRDWVDEGVTGFLVAPGSLESLTSCLEQVCGMPASLPGVGREARAREESVRRAYPTEPAIEAILSN